MRRATIFGGVLLAALYLFAWSNHFGNGFHFDDSHSIVNNVFVRDLSNLPAYFTDPATTTSLPSNRAWRPLVTLTVAIDYALAKGYSPFWYQFSTFVWFTGQILLMAWLFFTILRRTGVDEEPALWTAAFAAGWYGVHPVMAETVNYIVQRAEVLSTIGVVAGIALYAGLPEKRRTGLYLLPVAISFLAKAPAMVFPALLIAYIVLFEEPEAPGGFGRAVRQSVPAIGVTVAMLAITAAMTPKTFVYGASPLTYILVQPYVAFRYFTSFFLPFRLSADSDLAGIPDPATLEVFGGAFFIAVLIWAIAASARRKETRPISFGLAWFLIALLPTSLFPLAEVENDHRMFFPFVGLVLAVTWSGALLLLRRTWTQKEQRVLAGALACVLVLSAVGLRRRNEVWSSDEKLWEDVTVKSPRNGRGLMNYGLTQMSQAKYQRALTYFQRAAEFNPNYDSLEINLGIANGELHQNAEAEVHFRRALQLAPQSADAHYFYARWLRQQNRLPEAIAELKTGISVNPVYLDARTLLLTCYDEAGRVDELKALAQDTARLAPNDSTVQRYLNYKPGSTPPSSVAGNGPATPEGLLSLSLARYQAGDFQGCIEYARQSLKLRPTYAEAWNNVSAGYMALKNWDESIKAGEEALKINPDLQLAKNNVAYAKSQKALNK